MKKILIMVCCLCLTGCLVSNEDFEKTCTSVKETENLEETMSIYVVYDNEDTVKEAVVTRSYVALNETGEATLEEVKESALSYIEKYAGNDSIEITVSTDEEDAWEIKFYLDVPNLESDVLDDFMIRKNSIRFFNKMQDENIDCE